MDSEILDVGYIYKITSEIDDKIYYGSTINWKERRRNHNSSSNKCMTKLMCGEREIEVLEQFYNISRQDLKKKERFWIENHNETETGLMLLNKHIPTQTRNEYHKKKYAEKPKLYAAKQKVYYYENQKKELQRNKDYQEKRRGDTWFCVDCNQVYAWTTKKTHIKSKKHLNCVAATTTTESITLEN